MGWEGWGGMAGTDNRPIFNGIAAEYDWRSVGLSWGGLWAWHRVACTWLPIAPGERVLDVGCGTGVVLRRCAGRVGGRGSFVGVDPSAAMLAIAKRRSHGGSDADIQWIEGDGQELPLADSTFDWVTAQFSLRNMPEWPRALEEFARVLKPSGHLVILDLVRPQSVFGRLGLFYLRAATALPGLTAYRAIYTSVMAFVHGDELVAAIEASLSARIVKRWVGGLVILVVASKAAVQA